MLTGQAGGCRCGKIRFRINAEPLVTAVCHCRGCQKMTASAFSTTITLPAGALEIVAGEPVVGGLHGDRRGTIIATGARAGSSPACHPNMAQ